MISILMILVFDFDVKGFHDDGFDYGCNAGDDYDFDW